MGDQDALERLGVTGEWVWGDDEETIVLHNKFRDRETGLQRRRLPKVSRGL